MFTSLDESVESFDFYDIENEGQNGAMRLHSNRTFFLKRAEQIFFSRSNLTHFKTHFLASLEISNSQTRVFGVGVS